MSTRSAWTEIPILFGSEENLIGILTDPTVPSETKPIVIMLNAGVVHRIGPHRLHVTLARELAAKGARCFRLDLSGIGDSRALEGQESFQERAVIDVRAAIDALRKRFGSDLDVVLFGLCAGADNSIATAMVDPRVAGLIVVDQYTYASMRSRARRFATRAKKLAGVSAVLGWSATVGLRMAREKLGKLGAQQEGESEDRAQSGRTAPEPEVHGERLDALVSRGVAMLAIYSATHGERYNAPGQIFEVFPSLRGKVDERFFPEANHMFTELAMQRALIGAVSEWFERRYGSTSSTKRSSS